MPDTKAALATAIIDSNSVPMCILPLGSDDDHDNVRVPYTVDSIVGFKLGVLFRETAMRAFPPQSNMAC